MKACSSLWAGFVQPCNSALPADQIPCVHQEGSICGLIHDPCDCPQKMLGASCVIVPSEIPMATSAQKSTSFGGTGKPPSIPSAQGKGSLMEQPQRWLRA